MDPIESAGTSRRLNAFSADLTCTSYPTGRKDLQRGDGLSAFPSSRGKEIRGAADHSAGFGRSRTRSPVYDLVPGRLFGYRVWGEAAQGVGELTAVVNLTGPLFMRRLRLLPASELDRSHCGAKTVRGRWLPRVLPDPLGLIQHVAAPHLTGSTPPVRCSKSCWPAAPRRPRLTAGPPRRQPLTQAAHWASSPRAAR